MKHYNKILLLAVAAGMTVSCADAPFVEYKTEKPESLTKYEYLNEYGALTTYIDRTAHPGFKLGTGITASEFVKQDLVYSLAVSNYDDVTAGNAMKYSSIVADNGNMDFGTVKKFVKTAKEAELSIYGHTLCWHSQQNNKWLNSLIADKEIEVDPNAKEEVEDAHEDYSTATKIPGWGSDQAKAAIAFENGALKVVTTEATTNNYDLQYQPVTKISTKIGENYKVTLYIKGSKAGSLTVGLGEFDSGSGESKVKKMTSEDLPFTDQWSEVSVDLKNILVDNSFVLLQSGHYVGTYEIKWIKVTHTEAVSVTIPVTVAEYDFSDGKPLGGWDNSPAKDWTLTVENGACKVVVPSESTHDYDRQLCHETTTPFTNGTTYFLKLKVKGSIAGTIPVGFQDPVHNYAGRGDFTTLNVTTDWKEVTLKGTCNGEDATRLLFTVGGYIGTLYLDDICLYWEKPSNTIPMESEEKVKKLTDELERWIKGMMEACGGYVTAWDVVNEPISGGGNDGNGNYVLQSAVNPDDNGVGGQNFYWQDFLGDDYARIPIKFARKYFEEYGGKSEDLKLFINDYNLESWWDENKKLKSLINWIQRWESDGETKIDGIGTQMHVSYILNEADQKKQEESIVNMFKLLAASGKLVKITELDMGIVEKAFGDAILTENLTDEMQQKMSEFYKFIIQKYFEIIPVAQQYGITHWSPTDSPADSGWRKGQPIGLWDLNYNRKPVYVGFLEGLQNGAKGNSAAK